MKAKHLILFFSFMFISWGCYNEKTEEEVSDDPIHGIWNLINVSGGFVGIDSDYNKGEIIWEFDAANKTLKVQNNDTSNSIFSGLKSGHYGYSIVQNDGGRAYMFVGTIEMGGITIAQNEMTINQNDMSIGTGADRFVFKLIR
ncbi:hypothetical protein [uncultured Kriegella sp.]|uniref:hypothetical protein n=1 Tax=uncultured Kriegella sp. TaxID=1798910 RepID=UPI0030DC4AE1|tara:strand:+ start:103251 stop:103679 length:429 start_codon:yes stop_codon:yes gene_type:complete